MNALSGPGWCHRALEMAFQEDGERVETVEGKVADHAL